MFFLVLIFSSIIAFCFLSIYTVVREFIALGRFPYFYEVNTYAKSSLIFLTSFTITLLLITAFYSFGGKEVLETFLPEFFMFLVVFISSGIISFGSLYLCTAVGSLIALKRLPHLYDFNTTLKILFISFAVTVTLLLTVAFYEVGGKEVLETFLQAYCY